VPVVAAPSSERALHERAEHREEAASGTRDLGRIGAVGCHVAVAVQQVEAGHAHVVEREAAVVDAVEAALDAVVLALDAGEHRRLADRHEEAVHAVVHAARDELREHRRGAPVQRALPR
jgi:hypothetical protein